MTSQHHTNEKLLTGLNSVTPKNIEKNYLSCTSTSLNRWIKFCDVMTWRHDVTTSQHWKTYNIFEISDPKRHRNKKRINFLAHPLAEIGESGFVTSWHDVMTSHHDTNEKLITFSNSVTQKIMKTKKNQLSSTSVSWDRRIRICDVMTWRHDVTSWHKWKANNIFELSDPKNHGNKKRIIFLAHLQTKICILSYVTSWRHVEMLWRHMT